MVEQCNLDQEDKQWRINELISHKCLALMRLGRLDEAERIAAACLRLDSPGPGNPPAALLVIADIFMERGEWEKVLTLAEDTEHLLVESPVHLLGMLGRRCQALKRFPERLERGAEIAALGMAIAREIRNAREEAVFSIDLAQFLQLLGRYAEARTLAEQTIELCRKTGNVAAELSAFGILGQCCLELGDPDAARRHALFGFGRAGELKLTEQQVVFLCDLAQVALAETRVREAMAVWTNAIELASSVPMPGYWLGLARRIREMVIARREVDMAIDGLVAVVDSAFDAHPETLSYVLPPAVDMMKELYDAFGPARAGVIMGEVIARVLERRGGAAGSAPYRLLLDFAHGLTLLSKGHTTDALAWADGLDRATDGQLGLRSVLEELQTPKRGFLGLSRWFPGLGRVH